MLRAIENERLPEPDIELIKRVDKITEEEKLEFWKWIDEMYWHTPLFHLKGYSRWEDRKEKQHFSVIHGGKRD